MWEGWQASGCQPFISALGQEVSGFSLCSDIGEFNREGDGGCSCKDENIVFRQSKGGREFPSLHPVSLMVRRSQRFDTSQWDDREWISFLALELIQNILRYMERNVGSERAWYSFVIWMRCLRHSDLEYSESMKWFSHLPMLNFLHECSSPLFFVLQCPWYLELNT